ncbi:MAG: sugar transferase [Eubacteriales bacterium]|nr:sugar transferase [Eubacteriales bacterium]
MDKKRKLMENALILTVDLIALLIGNFLAYYTRYRDGIVNYYNSDTMWLVLSIALIYIFVSVFSTANRHFFRRGYLEEFIGVVKLLALTLLGLVVELYIFHKSSLLSRLVFGYFTIYATALIYLNRILLKKYMLKTYKYGRFSNRLLIVTSSDRVDTIIDNLYDGGEWSRVIAGVVITDKPAKDVQIKNGRYKLVCELDELIEYVTHNNIDEVFFSVANIANDSFLRKCLETFEQMGIEVSVNIEMFNLLNTVNKGLGRIGKYAVVVFARNNFSLRQQMMKRMLDIVGSLVGMLLLGIATIIVGPLIKLESEGPVFFGQKRVGRNGRIFTCYKFRSMYIDAEERKKELMKQNEMSGLMFKMENDPRITKVGKFIRKTSIDELPQFWNILRGDMSLVGTRPPTLDEYEKYDAWHKSRLSMTPGLTGMWQISGRSEIKDFDDVVRLDMEYIDGWNIMKDIKILIKTVVIVLTGKGAE